MDNKTILIIGAVAIAVFFIVRNGKKSEPREIVEPENEQPEDEEPAAAVVDTSFLEDMAVADRGLIAAGDDTTWNNIAGASATR